MTSVGLLESFPWRGSARSRRERIASAHWSAVLFFLAAIGLLAYCLSDYRINWMHPETWSQQRVYLGDRASFNWELWPQFFNCEIISGGGCTRARLLSYLFSYMNAFFRLWLVDHLPPHPSLSLTWALSIASIYLLYRVILDLTRDRSAALLGAGLYVLSSGFLSNLIFLFHPAKPLAGFFVNLCLFLAVSIGRARLPSAYAALSVLLLACLLLAYFSDETTWILGLAILILCPYLLQRPHRPLLIGVVASFPLFLALVTWVVPILVKHYWSYDFTFWSYIFNVGPAAEPNSPPLLERISTARILAVALNVAGSQYAWWRSGPLVATLSSLAVAAAIGAAAIAASRESRSLLLRAVVLLGIFLLFQSLVLLRHFTNAGTFYYGALYANFAALVVGVAMASVRDVRGANAICTLAAIYLGYVSFTWCLAFNAAWIPMHYPHHDLRSENHFTASQVVGYWMAVRRGDDVRNLPLPLKEQWLADLMDNWRQRHRARLPARSAP